MGQEIRIKNNLIGRTFGRLTVIERAEDYIQSNGRKRTQWYCRCDCGNIIVCETSNLTTGHTKSCGCYQKHRNSETHTIQTKFEIHGNIAIGYTQTGDKFFVDIDKIDMLNGHSWWISENGYVCGHENNTVVMLHRILTNCPDNMVVDHINHNKADNRLCNLRICTQSENQYNKSKLNSNTSGTTGVCWDNKRNSWRAYISVNKKRIELGHYTNINDAISARLKAEETYYKEFSFNNSIKEIFNV